jgi:hypothetical protein
MNYAKKDAWNQNKEKEEENNPKEEKQTRRPFRFISISGRIIIRKMKRGVIHWRGSYAQNNPNLFLTPYGLISSFCIKMFGKCLGYVIKEGIVTKQ